MDGKDENGNLKFKWEAAQDAKIYKNTYGLDLFRIEKNISEGKSGFKICDIDKLDSIVQQYGIDKINQIIQQHIDKYGLSPRYTRPDETKKEVFHIEEQSKQDKGIIAMDCYKNRHRYMSVYNENGIEFFVEQRNKDEFNATLFICVNGYMVGIEQKHRLEEAIKRMNEINEQGGIIQFITDKINQAFADPKRWVDEGMAIILDREEEAKEHNKTIRVIREQEREEEDQKRKAEHKAEVDAVSQKAKEQIKKAVNIIKNGGKLPNAEIKICYGDTIYECNTYSIINHLATLYNVNIPIKVKGWINGSLTAVEIENGEAVRYWRNGNPSTTFFQYMNDLIFAVQNKESIDSILISQTSNV
jgi:hypothetical protein